jgi:hypothetical protein
MLENIDDENKITNSSICSMNETSYTVMQLHEKIVPQEGKHQVGAISLCKRGQTVTCAYAVSAGFFYVLPVLMCARKRMKESLSCGAPADIVFHCQDKSWMDYEVFCEWKRHFISLVKPMSQEKVLY